MSKAKISINRVIFGISLFALFINIQCTKDQPVIVPEETGRIVGVVKPVGVVAKVKILQGVVVDSTFSDSLNGYFEIKDVKYGTYNLEVTANNYGKYIENRIVVNGITAIGDIYLKKTPEQISNYQPYNGSVNIPLTMACTIHFSTLMDHASVENAFNFSPAVKYYSNWDDDNQKSVLHVYPAPRYKAFTSYTFSLSTVAKTLYGDSLAFPISSTFTTEPVQIQTSSPETGSNYISCSTLIYIRFNTAMNRTTVENSFTISPNTAGDFVWHNNESFSYRPTDYLESNTSYSVSISRNARDIHGTPIGDVFSVNFSTEPLKIDYTYPLNGATNINTNASIQIVFNVNVDQTATERSFSISPAVTGVFGWTDQRRFSFYPDRLLDVDTIYEISIDTSCKDSYGKPLPEKYVFSFQTITES